MRKSAQQKLPDKPSDLILLAMQDLEACERDPRYKINMGKWVAINGTCSVCLAGSVMARTLGVGEALMQVRALRENPVVQGLLPGLHGALANATTRQVAPEDCSYDSENKLTALNEFRCGRIHAGLDCMEIAVPDSLSRHVIEDRYGYAAIEPGELYCDLDSLSFRHDLTEWKEHMATIVGILQAEGL